MTDRELLERAAKAAGHGLEFDEMSGLVYMDSKFTGLLWDPLHNDGDALRLAVKLNMDLLGTGQLADGTACRSVIFPTNEDWDSISEPVGSDPYAATRRAIVRAAAEMAG